MSKKQQRGNKEHKKPKQEKAQKAIIADPFGKGAGSKAGAAKK